MLIGTGTRSPTLVAQGGEGPLATPGPLTAKEAAAPEFQIDTASPKKVRRFTVAAPDPDRPLACRPLAELMCRRSMSMNEAALGYQHPGSMIGPLGRARSDR
jgi:hypothetical protein